MRQKQVAGRRDICWSSIFYTFKRRKNPITNWDVNSLIKLSNKYTFKNQTPLQITHFHCRPIDKKENIRPIFLEPNSRISGAFWPFSGQKQDSKTALDRGEVREEECPDQKFQTRSRYFSSNFLWREKRRILPMPCGHHVAELMRDAEG